MAVLKAFWRINSDLLPLNHLVLAQRQMATIAETTIDPKSYLTKTQPVLTRAAGEYAPRCAQVSADSPDAIAFVRCRDAKTTPKRGPPWSGNCRSCRRKAVAPEQSPAVVGNCRAFEQLLQQLLRIAAPLSNFCSSCCALPCF